MIKHVIIFWGNCSDSRKIFLPLTEVIEIICRKKLLESWHVLRKENNVENYLRISAYYL
jgi:hypothetical protein